MFKLALISTLATSAVNAVDVEADADTMAYLDADRHPWAGPPAGIEGPFPRRNQRKHRNIAPIGNIEDITFGPPRGRRSDSRGKPPRVVRDEERRPALKRRPRRGGFDGPGPVTSSSAKEAELRERLGRYGGRRSNQNLSKRVIGGRRPGYGGRGPRGPRGAPRRPHDDGAPRFGLKPVAPLREPRLPEARSLRGLKGLAPLRGPPSNDAPEFRQLAPLRP